MLEYTIAVGASFLILIILDLWIMKTRLLLQRKFWIFLILVVSLQTIVDNYLNGRWWLDSFIVGPYDTSFYSGIRIIETPLENYGFGIAMMWLNVIIFESLLRTDLFRAKN